MKYLVSMDTVSEVNHNKRYKTLSFLQWKLIFQKWGQWRIREATAMANCIEMLLSQSAWMVDKHTMMIFTISFSIPYFSYLGIFLPPANEVWGKVMFYTCLSFCPREAGGVSQHAMGRGCGNPLVKPSCTDTPWADTPSPRDRHRSGWYASYWNAFLFKIIFLTKIVDCSNAQIRSPSYIAFDTVWT